jgi:pyruvate-formate lyase
MLRRCYDGPVCLSRIGGVQCLYELLRQEGHNLMRDLVLSIRDSLLATEDSVCLERAQLVTEAYRRFEGDPPPLKRAKAFDYLLRHMTLDLETNPFFAGNMSTRPRSWMLLPEYGFGYDAQILLEHPQLAGLLDEQVPRGLVEFWVDRSFGGNAGIGHLAVDLHRVVHEGLSALIDEAERLADVGSPERRLYRQAMVIALQGVMAWAGRYAEAAEMAAGQAVDPIVREAYLRVARACRHVPAHPARELFEALQAILLVHLALHIEGHGLSVSIGLPDRILAPFITPDLDPEAATNLIAAFMLKVNANSIFGRGSKTQAITVGGVDLHGTDQCNLLTQCFLDAADLVRVGDPHVFLRWHTNIAPEIKRRAIGMLAAGVSVPLLVNDAVTVQGLIRVGVVPDDAWDYCVIGCNELGIPGRSAESATATNGTVQYLELLNEVLLTHAEPDTIASVDELLGLLESRMAEVLPAMRRQGRAHRQRVAAEMPMPLTSALMRNGIRRGQDFMVGMDYHLPNLYERGLTNAINALAAIQQVVFEERVASLSDLVAAQRANFEGAGRLRARLQVAPKWGNDDERADRFAPLLPAMRERVLNSTAMDGRPAAGETARHTVCHVVRSLHHLDGKRIAASPDGRLAWTPVADSIGAESGTAHAGPTGILNSVAKLGIPETYAGGTNLNLTLPASQWRDPELQSDLLALVETAFAQGTQELQIAVLDADVLRDAQAHPERHGDLLVRIAGFNARFVDLGQVEQEELIRRAADAEG